MFWLEVQDYLKKMSSQVVCQSIRDKPLNIYSHSFSGYIYMYMLYILDSIYY